MSPSRKSWRTAAAAFAGITCVSLFTPARRDCVSDYVNEQRLAELREYNEFNLWDKLLPWEKAALPHDTDQQCAMMEPAHAYAAKHGMTL